MCQVDRALTSTRVYSVPFLVLGLIYGLLSGPGGDLPFGAGYSSPFVLLRESCSQEGSFLQICQVVSCMLLGTAAPLYGTMHLFRVSCAYSETGQQKNQSLEPGWVVLAGRQCLLKGAYVAPSVDNSVPGEMLR